MKEENIKHRTYEFSMKDLIRELGINGKVTRMTVWDKELLIIKTQEKLK